jgi:hypothetical protein
LSRTRRRAVLVAVTLAFSVVTVAPAAAATQHPVSKPGQKVMVYRGDVRRGPGAAAMRAQRLTVVPGSPATPRSVWNVTYTGFTPQAKAAFQAAVDIWKGIIASPVTINVSADFGDLGPGVLGFAGPHAIVPLPGEPASSPWYPVALANALTGSDLIPPSSGESGVDIEASFSSTEPGIYYGTDSNPPANDIDFESIVLHELGHGLGFTGSATYQNGVGSFESPPFVYDEFNISGTSVGTRFVDKANNSTSLGSAFTSDNAYWDGSEAVAANGGNRPKLYAPSSWSDGSSMAHLDEVTYPQGDPNSLMTPFVDNQEVIHSPGPITVGVMRDLGWDAVLAAPGAPTNVVGEPDTSAVDLSWTAPAANGSPITGYTINVNDGSSTTQFASPGTATARIVTGLSNLTTYTFTVQATNGVGTGPVSAVSAAVQPAADTVAPSVTITSRQTSGVGAAAGSYTFTGTDPGHAHPVITYACVLDGGSAAPCTSPVTYSGYAHGSTHTFSVTPTDGSSNVGSPAAASWTTDAQAPTVTAATLSTYTVARTVGLGATGADVGSGVKNYDFRYHKAAWNAGWLALTYPASWQGITQGVSLPVTSGYTYCLSVRVRDMVGNVSPWSPDRCTSTPIDDRALAPSAGWVEHVREVLRRHGHADQQGRIDPDPHDGEDPPVRTGVGHLLRLRHRGGLLQRQAHQEPHPEGDEHTLRGDLADHQLPLRAVRHGRAEGRLRRDLPRRWPGHEQGLVGAPSYSEAQTMPVTVTNRAQAISQYLAV